MTHTVTGLFGSRRTADLVVEHLVQEYGIPRERVRVYAQSGEAEARSPQDSHQGASLRDLRLPEQTARGYADGIARGGILVAAHVGGDRVDRIVAAYREYSATSVDSQETEWSSGASAE